MTSIDIPKTVTVIGDGAFSGCDSLRSVNITDLASWCRILFEGPFSNPLYYARHLFLNGEEVIDLIIPNSVTSISYTAFMNCSSIKNIEVPNSVTHIGEKAFYGTQWYDNQPKGLVYVGLVAYEYKGEMPDGTNIILKAGTVEITDRAFFSCIGLKNIDLPNSITRIGDSAFGECSGLTNIIIPNSVTAIDKWAFCWSGLTSIHIGNSVSSIGEEAFFYCQSIQDVYCYAANPPTCEDSTFETYSATLHVPATSLAAYFTAPCWSNFENIVGDAVVPTGISINKDSVEVNLGEQFKLIVTVTPSNASYKEIHWYSTDMDVATVDNGNVTIIGAGECDIIASCFGMQVVCHVSAFNRISLDQQEAMLLPNHMLTLTPTAPAMPEGFMVNSSNPTVAVARVMNGKVQVVGIKEGNSIITVGSTDGMAVPATCLVTVYTEPGDANMDGFVNINDVTDLINYLLTDDPTGIKIANVDLNNDGNININDLTTLINILLTTD